MRLKKPFRPAQTQGGGELLLSGRHCQEFAAVLNPWHGLICKLRAYSSTTEATQVMEKEEPHLTIPRASPGLACVTCQSQ